MTICMYKSQFKNLWLKVASYQETHPEGKAQYTLIVLSSLDKMLLILKTIFTFLQNKQPKEEVNRTKPSPSVRFPCSYPKL
jgi:hypothetical protein